jgi:hypothetical protein
VCPEQVLARQRTELSIYRDGIDWPAMTEGPPLQARFVAGLIAQLNQHAIQYCVLHSYEDLPDQIVSDIDIACYAEDLRSIRLLFLRLRLGEYQLIQYLEYAPCASYFVFARNDLRKSESVAIDVICAHTRGGLLLKPGTRTAH